MLFRLFVFLIICVWSCAWMQAQPMVLTELPTQGQLPVAHIHRVLQDAEGYMWYATEGGGLCRDDGYRIEVFRSTPQSPGLLASNTVTCLAEDLCQRIWFGTEAGLYVLDKADYQVRLFEPKGISFADKRVDALRVATDGTIWVSAQRQIFHLSPLGHILGHYDSVWDGQPVSVSDFYEDRHGTLWVLQWKGGLLRYDVAANSMQPCLWNCDAFPCQMVEGSQAGEYWVATWGKGVVRYTRNEGVCVQPCTYADTAQSPHKALVLGLLFDDRRGILWVVAMDDLYVYGFADGQLVPRDASGFLPEGKKILDRPVEDKWQNIWVPGYSPHTFIISSHINRIRRDGVKAMTDLTGYPVMVDRIVADGGFYWIWQGRTGLSLYDPAAGRMAMASDMPGELARVPIRKCIEKCVRKRGIWTCSGERVLRLWHEGMMICMEEIVRVEKGGQVNALCDDGNGALWVGAGESLYRYDERSGEMRHVFSDKGAVRNIVQAPDGTVYAVCADGLMHVGKGMRCEEIARGTDYTVAGVAANGNVYVGASFGHVYVYNPLKREFRVEENAGNRNGDAVKSLAVDGLGHVWVLTDQYVKEYNPANGSFCLLRNSDAEIGMDYFHTVCQVGDSVCVGGIGAFCMIGPSLELDKAAQSVKPLVSTYSVNGERHFVGAGTGRIEIPPGKNVLDLSFSTLDHLHTRQINYAYRLKGKKTDWVYLPSGTNTVSLAHLPAGDYVVEVMATDMHGCWGEPIECLTVCKLPFWHETWWARLLFVLVAAYLAGMGVRTYFTRMKKKQQEQLERQLTQMKFRFFTNVSHELRTPLTLIITPLEHLMETIRDERLVSRLHPIYLHACELMELINHLLDFRKLETAAEKLYLLNGDIVEFVRTTCEAFHPLAESRNIAFRCETLEECFFMNFDRDKIHRVLYNLLGNAFKFTPTGGNIEVRAGLAEDGDAFFVEVKDDGSGIAAKDLPEIFNRYFQSKNGAAEGGSGIGLYLVKAYVEMHGGRVEADSKEGEGAVFKVFLPTNLTQEVSYEEKGAGELSLLTNQSRKGARKALLVVEDNADLRSFLVRSLADEYDVHEAANGIEAETEIRVHGAEVVVSDVRMPGMDGFEFCRRLKQDVRTSHIFVILLSAYGQDAERLEGYEAGADCYLTKPFNMNILRNRIRHFFELQDRRKKMFLSATEFSAKDIAPTKMDEVFLGKAADCVETHLDDLAYSVEQFSRDMCMSRMNLYRKLQSLTGQTPSEFVRAIRLKKGAQMLASGIPTVAEVADRVGFSTPSYFSKCFKEMFGVLPTQYKG